MNSKATPEIEGERSFIKGLGFIGTGQDSNSSVIEVKNSKIVRIRPLHYEWKSDLSKIKILE